MMFMMLNYIYIYIEDVIANLSFYFEFVFHIISGYLALLAFNRILKAGTITSVIIHFELVLHIYCIMLSHSTSS